MSILFLVLLALAAGCGLSVQAGVNAQLGSQSGHHAVWATFISFLIGSAFLLPFTFLPRSDWPPLTQLAAVPWWTWLGGLIGAGYVLSTVTLAPRLGATAFFAIVIAGQVAMSLILDQFGLIGFERHPVNPMRMLGAALVAAGVFMVRRF